MSGNSCPSNHMFATAGRCRQSLLLKNFSSSLTEPTHISLDADSNSRSSTIRNSAITTKSQRVLRGQPTSRNAFAMQWFSLRIYSTLWYLVWPDYGCWCKWHLFVEVAAEVCQLCIGAEYEPRPWVLLASANSVCRVLTASDFVRTRLANSSVSFSCSSNLSSGFCRRWFWKDWLTLLWSFIKASYFF